MPWSIKTNVKGCDGFAVVKNGSSQPVPGGCHKTQGQAYKHLIAIRLSYEERAFSSDQPRGPDGKFASTGGSDDGGGGAPSPAIVKKGGTYKAGDKPGSKVKSAPNNVTSKGVNPNSEYVLSQKTGNFFANPRYNGNPEGKGKYSPNGRLKDQQGSIDDLEGGSKYLATGQSKFKDNSTSTGKPTSAKPQPAVGKIKVGRIPKGYAKGQKLDPLNDPDQGSIIVKVSKARFGTGDQRLQTLADEQGFSGKPAVLKTQEEVDQLSREGWTTVYRGTSENPSRSYSTEFAEGQYYPGLGIYGNGTYTSTFRSTAESYAGNTPGRTVGGLNEILISPDANVITYGELRNRRSKFKDEISQARDKSSKDYSEELSKASKTGKIADIPKDDYDRITADFRVRSEVIDAAETVAENEGAFAAMIGVDAYKVEKAGAKVTYKTGKGGRKVKVVEYEDYFVILNRTAVATRVVRP